MKCCHCGGPLTGFADTRIVKINRDKAVACADLAACVARRDEAEREQREHKAEGVSASEPGRLSPGIEEMSGLIPDLYEGKTLKEYMEDLRRRRFPA